MLRSVRVHPGLVAFALVLACKPAAEPTSPQPLVADSTTGAGGSAPESADPPPPANAGEVPNPNGSDAVEPLDEGNTTSRGAMDPPPESPPDPQPEPETAPDPKPEPPKAASAGGLPKPLYRDVKSSCGRDPGVGTKLKGFRLKNLAGKEISNNSYRNRVMLVNFWGTWCKPCLKELPEFDRLYRRYRKHGMTLVAIATDEDPEPVQAFVDKRKLRAKVLLGGEDYAGQYGAPNFPFSYVVDTTGTIIGSYHNYKEECMGKLEDDLRTALDKRNAKKK